MNDDVLEQIAAIEAARPSRRSRRKERQARKTSAPAASVGFNLGGLFLMLRGIWLPMVVVGTLGFLFFPGTPHRIEYSRAVVLDQIADRIGALTPGGYKLAELVVFRPDGSQYDYAVTISHGGRQSTAFGVGALAYDQADASIKVTRPSDIIDASGTTQDLKTDWRQPVAAITGLIDTRRNMTMSAEAQSFANLLPLFRVSDADRAKLAENGVDRVERTANGLTIIYREGTGAVGWLFGFLTLLGLFARLTKGA